MELTLDLNKRYTHADYYSWRDDARRELIDGFISILSSSPGTLHQSILISLAVEISMYLKKKKSHVFMAPFDIRLSQNGEKDDDKIYTVVQPDICVIIDSSKLDERGCLGAPDFIAEIVSPSNSKHDVETKFQLYQKHGVREYWIVFPNDKSISVFMLSESRKYEMVGMYAGDSKVPVNIINGDLLIDLTDIFEAE